MKRGPEIKMPQLHVPQFLVDLYYDLYDRHLLPVVGVLLVGIVAIPLLLGGSSGSDSGSPSGAAAASATATAEPSAVLVKKATPGLRDYRRRLDHLHPKDPFRQQYATKEGEGETREGETAPAGSTSTEGESSESSGSVESGGTAPAPTHVETKTKVTYFSVAIDVRVIPVADGDGKPSDAGPSVRRDLPPLVALPSRETPALTYMRPSRDGKKALMVVSSDVTSLFGDSPCLIGSETCQLLGLEPDMPETVVWGANGRTFRIELLSMHLVASSRLNRSSLGKPKHSAPAGRD
jgi:hypothetical protein